MLAEDSRPPQFHLTDAAGQAVTLSPFLGRDRILLVFVPPAQAAAGEQFARHVESMRRDYAERDLAVLLVAPAASPLMQTPSRPPLHLLADPHGKTAAAYGASGETTTYLIGKDGGIKMARRGFPEERGLFATIDAMPMRRQEMRDRRR